MIYTVYKLASLDTQAAFVTIDDTISRFLASVTPFVRCYGALDIVIAYLLITINNFSKSVLFCNLLILFKRSVNQIFYTLMNSCKYRTHGCVTWVYPITVSMLASPWSGNDYFGLKDTAMYRYRDRFYRNLSIPHISDLCCPIAKAVASTDVNCWISGIRIQRAREFQLVHGHGDTSAIRRTIHSSP